jgi:hypothetical protein
VSSPHCRGGGKAKTPGADVTVAKYDHGEVTAADVQAELNRLPPPESAVSGFHKDRYQT